MKHIRVGKGDKDPSPRKIQVVTPAWLKERRTEVAALRACRERDPSADTLLLLPAEQHPLVDGRYPGPEFATRLDAAVSRHDEIIASGGKAEFFLSGSRHHDAKSDQTDRVALYDAGGLWLLQHGIPATSLHGPDWTENQGVYSGAAEILLLRKVFGTIGASERQNTSALPVKSLVLLPMP